MNVMTFYESHGVRFVAGPDDKGWAKCHAFDREDKNPSAAVNVKTGYYKDHASGAYFSIFDFLVKIGRHADYSEALMGLADHVGLDPPTATPTGRQALSSIAGPAHSGPAPRQSGNGPPPHRPPPAGPASAEKGSWRDNIDFAVHQSQARVRNWCRFKGLDPEAARLCGARCARWPAKSPMPLSQWPMAFLVRGQDGSEVGCVVVQPGTELLELYRGKARPPDLAKSFTVKGSSTGLVGDHGSDLLINASVVWKVEGVTDLVALQGLIPPPLRDSHVVVTNPNGAGERPPPWWPEAIRGKVVYVVHDCDKPGQAGARRWCRAAAATASEMRNVVLPYPVEPKHGKDVRDYAQAGNNYDALQALALAAEVVEPGAADPAAEQDGRKPIGTVGNPSRLANEFLDSMLGQDMISRLRYHQDEWLLCECGAYHVMKTSAVEDMLSRFIERSFDAVSDALSILIEQETSGNKIKERTVTRRLVGDVLALVRNRCRVLEAIRSEGRAVSCSGNATSAGIR
jgi:hypothetical protein